MPSKEPPKICGRVPLARELAIDLGTANTLVYERGRGVVLNQPSVVAVDKRAQIEQVVAVGIEAWLMIGRTPEYIEALRPLRSGAITKIETVRDMIRFILNAIGVGRFGRTRVLVCVPSILKDAERRALIKAVRDAGVSEIKLLDQSMAAAVGSGLPIHEPRGTMMIDVGGGTVQSAVLSLGGIVNSQAERVGSFNMDEALQDYARRTHGVLIGERTAEEIKIGIGSAHEGCALDDVVVTGRDLTKGLPREFVLTHDEVRSALRNVVREIVQSISNCVSSTPPSITQDLLRNGAHLLGGGSLLRGLATQISERTFIPIHRSPDPMQTVVLGAGKVLENWNRVREEGDGLRL